MTREPLGGLAPPFKCGRLMRWPDVESRCPNDATWHVFWTTEGDNTIDCATHVAEIVEKGDYITMHRYDTVCSMPGAVFVWAENRCVVDEEALGLAHIGVEPVSRSCCDTVGGEPHTGACEAEWRATRNFGEAPDA